MAIAAATDTRVLSEASECLHCLDGAFVCIRNRYKLCLAPIVVYELERYACIKFYVRLWLTTIVIRVAKNDDWACANLCSKRRKWSRRETLGLLKCYLARKEEFKHSRKKKYAYSNILEDMMSQGLVDSSTTTTALEGKMRTLLTAYKCAKDNAKQTGATPCIPPYFEELEEIFGSKPLIANAHTLHLGRGPISSLDDGNLDSNQGVDCVEDLEVEYLYEPTEVPTAFLPASPDLPNTDLPSTSAAARSNKRKSPRDCYYAAKLELKAKAVEEKNAQRAEFYKNIFNSFNEKWKEESKFLKEAEDKKIDLLQTILNK